MKNEYGLDVSYFENKLKLLLRDVSRYSPTDLQVELSRMAETAAPVVNESARTHGSTAGCPSVEVREELYSLLNKMWQEQCGMSCRLPCIDMACRENHKEEGGCLGAEFGDKLIDSFVRSAKASLIKP